MMNSAMGHEQCCLFAFLLSFWLGHEQYHGTQPKTQMHKRLDYVWKQFLFSIFKFLFWGI